MLEALILNHEAPSCVKENIIIKQNFLFDELENVPISNKSSKSTRLYI